MIDLSPRTRIADCRIIELGQIHHRSGNLTIVEGQKLIPFSVRRVYYLYDVPGGAERGGHAHLELHQFIIAASGSFDVLLDDGEDKKVVSLNRSHFGLLVMPGVWRELKEFSSGAICLVLASNKFEEKDYIRDYSIFINYLNVRDNKI